jgi:tetratricopeptide (TPR) repeat protein
LTCQQNKGEPLYGIIVTEIAESQSRRVSSWLLGLVLVTFVAYQPVWHAGFIWDDDDHLTANPAMTAPNGLQMIWSSLDVSRYYPLTLTSFWVQRRLWGLNPVPYHLTNIALHAINGILIFLVLCRLRVPAAWLAAALWLLHPVNVESVAWVTELKNTQSGVFFFCALLCFLQFEEREQRRWYALALLCAAGALLSKPSTVVLPLALLLCVWWERGRWRRVDIVRTAPFFAFAFAMSALTIVEQRRHIIRQGEAEWSLGLAERFVIAGKAIWFYGWKVLWPLNLVFVYPRWEVVANSIWSWLPLFGVVAGGVFLWVLRRQQWARAGLFGFVFFVTALLPVLGFFNVFYFRYSFVADHFQYLASLGIVALAASGIALGLERSGLWAAPAGNAICTGLLLTLAGLSWQQAQIYRDVETLWRDTVRKNPNAWIAHDLLGNTLTQAGKPEEAMGHFEQALRIKPDYPEAHNNLGVVLEQAGRTSEAIGHYERALWIKPNYPDAYYNLGIALEQTGEIQEAIRCYERALQIKPDYAEAHNNLGSALARQGQMQDAIAHWEQALQINRDFAEAHNNLGSALLRLGKVQEAIREYEEALRINPDYAKAHYNLGAALEQVGRVQEAIGHYEQAVRLRPDLADAHNALSRLRLGQ